jgi:hypothetical protein
MVEQRPFKALVVGSSPTQPKAFYLDTKSAELLLKPFGSARAQSIKKSHSRISFCLLLFFRLLLADSARLTAV